MATVTEIRDARGVARLSFDDAAPLKVRLKHFKALPLKVGDDVDVEEYAARVAEAQRADAYEAALGSLDLCARTRQELRRSLLARGFVSAAVEATLDRLADSGLINDRRYAERAVEVSAARPVGVYAVAPEIARQGHRRGGRRGGAGRARRRAAVAGRAGRGALAFAQIRAAPRPRGPGKALAGAGAARLFLGSRARSGGDAVWEADEWDE